MRADQPGRQILRAENLRRPVCMRSKLCSNADSHEGGKITVADAEGEERGSCALGVGHIAYFAQRGHQRIVVSAHKLNEWVTGCTVDHREVVAIPKLLMEKRAMTKIF